MNTGEFLAQATARLQAAGIDTARLDCLILLEDALGKNRATILAHPEQPIDKETLHTLELQLAQRVRHKPLAYIRGKSMFYGREFIVNQHVLVPRPETEDMINLLKKLPVKDAQIADIGTGSGCIAITASLELPGNAVDAYDISQSALAIAERNSQQLAADIRCLTSDLLSSLVTNYNVILANLPYVPDHYPINTAAGFEPEVALFAGPDGMDTYKLFWQQAHE